MKRTIIKIDEEKCTGCGLCVNGCHEGALQLIEGKAVMISELYCDGLGACIGDCPKGAITLEEREAEPYSETAVMERLSLKGEKVINAHLQHLLDHNQQDLYNEGITYLKKHSIPIKEPVIEKKHEKAFGGCSGSKSVSFENNSTNVTDENASSQLQQWPVQLHLLSPDAPYLKGCDLLIAADCTAFSVGNFHSRYLKGKRLAIACPKLDGGKEIYIEKITDMINRASINTITVLIMEVPCCGGLLQLVQIAAQKAHKKVPIKVIVVGLKGNVINEEWI